MERYGSRRSQYLPVDLHSRYPLFLTTHLLCLTLISGTDNLFAIQVATSVLVKRLRLRCSCRYSESGYDILRFNEMPSAVKKEKYRLEKKMRIISERP